MRSLLISAIVLLAASAVSGVLLHPKDLHQYNFRRFCSDFGRQYTGEEYAVRQTLFEKELASVLAHNADTTQSYHRTINEFSDWTASEMKRLRGNIPMTQEALQATPVRLFNNSDLPFLPKKVDYRTWTSPRVLTGIKSQGSCGGCWSFSAASTMESMFAMKFGQLPVLSPQQTLSCTPKMFGCGGGMYFAAWEYIQSTTGMNEEWVYPFTDFFAGEGETSACYNVTKKWPPTFQWYPKALVDGSYLVQPNSAEAMREAIARIGPMSIAVDARTWNSYHGGIMSNPPLIDDFILDHAVQMVGYGYDIGSEQAYWIVRNSWGNNWGEGGYVRLLRPAEEPCGKTASGNPACGTFGCLTQGGYPNVKQLAKRNI